MKILIVGAGAVGQVYGHHLVMGGAQVSVFVRPKYRQEAEEGFVLYPLRKKGKYDAVKFRAESVLTSFDEVKASTWDQVWICVPTTALVHPWIDELVAATGDATIVIFPSAVDAIEKLDAVLPRERTVFGLIPMMSYFAPIEGETLETPGVAYWFPPLSSTILSGEKKRRDAVIGALERGGCAASVHKDAREAAAFGGAIFISHIVALEGAGWSFARLVGSSWLREAVSASREALVAAAAHIGKPTPFLVNLVRPWTMKLVLRLVSWLAPLDVEMFFKVHFSKVREQTKLQMSEYIAFASTAEKPSGEMQKLTSAVFGEAWSRQLAAGSDS